ncbi:hypothetical protein HDU80_004445 [Chytriomyces hyalinus]|nr:hypothetical protein HDU80_004445 [Chytriomyces hyalinus]
MLTSMAFNTNSPINVTVSFSQTSSHSHSQSQSVSKVPSLSQTRRKSGSKSQRGEMGKARNPNSAKKSSSKKSVIPFKTTKFSANTTPAAKPWALASSDGSAGTLKRSILLLSDSQPTALTLPAQKLIGSSHHSVNDQLRVVPKQLQAKTLAQYGIKQFTARESAIPTNENSVRRFSSTIPNGAKLFASNAAINMKYKSGTDENDSSLSDVEPVPSPVFAPVAPHSPSDTKSFNLPRRSTRRNSAIDETSKILSSDAGWDEEEEDEAALMKTLTTAAARNRRMYETTTTSGAEWMPWMDDDAAFEAYLKDDAIVPML